MLSSSASVNVELILILTGCSLLSLYVNVIVISSIFFGLFFLALIDARKSLHIRGLASSFFYDLLVLLVCNITFSLTIFSPCAKKRLIAFGHVPCAHPEMRGVVFSRFFVVRVFAVLF